MKFQENKQDNQLHLTISKSTYLEFVLANSEVLFSIIPSCVQRLQWWNSDVYLETNLPNVQLEKL